VRRLFVIARSADDGVTINFDIALEEPQASVKGDAAPGVKVQRDPTTYTLHLPLSVTLDQRLPPSEARPEGHRGARSGVDRVSAAASGAGGELASGRAPRRRVRARGLAPSDRRLVRTVRERLIQENEHWGGPESGQRRAGP
jgi:hypothetical protein